jgi:hypothetical protein
MTGGKTPRHGQTIGRYAMSAANEMELARSADRIVVGIDGSEGSLRALSWAGREARLRGATLEVVAVWTYPIPVLLFPAAPEFPEIEKLANETHDLIDGARQGGRGRRGCQHRAPGHRGLRPRGPPRPGEGGRSPRPGQPGSRRFWGSVAGLGEPAMRAPCDVSRRSRPVVQRGLIAPRSPWP